MKITFLPQNIVREANAGDTILKAAISANVNIDGNCAGGGTCGKCKIKIISGDKNNCIDPYHKLSDIEIINGYRLACCHQVSDGMIIEMPEVETTAARKKNLIKLSEGFIGKSAVHKFTLNVPLPNLSNQESADNSIRNMLSNETIRFSVGSLKKLSKILKKTRTITLTIMENLIIDVEQGNTISENYGVAVDIGTTTVVIMLWNLNSYKMISISAVTNPQGVYGADVISRIDYTMQEEKNLENIQELIINCINKAIEEFEKTQGICRENIYQFTVVGNTTMNHIFIGTDPSQLAVLPFSPVFIEGPDTLAREIGLLGNKNAKVNIVANIAGHVGSDITAGLITTDIMESEIGHLFIDIGTNGEIVLSSKGRIVACSTAAGPAFEGSSISQGMRAARGAIEKVEISDDGVEISVIGNSVPIGICGSGIIDAVGEMIRNGIVDKSGRILSTERLRKKGVSENIIKHVRDNELGNYFILYFNKDENCDIQITQKDVREVQLAKAAISAGITILMKEIGITINEIEKVSIAGAFGNYIRKTSAIIIGLLPKIELNNIVSIGNAAGIGASMILLSTDCEKEADNIIKKIEHIELAARKDFQEQYIAAMFF